MNPRRRSHGRRRRARRNPPSRLLGGLLAGVPPVRRLIAGVIGAGATRIVPGLVNRFVPSVPTTGPLGLGFKALATLLMGGLAQRFAGKQFGEDFTFAGLVILGDEAARAYIYPVAGLAGYMDDTGASAYLSAYLNGAGMESYLAPAQQLGQFSDPNDYGPLSGMDSPSRLEASSRF